MKYNFNSFTSLIVFLITLVSCSDMEEIESAYSKNTTSECNESRSYSDNYLSNPDLLDNWENVQTVYLNSENKFSPISVHSPWNSTSFTGELEEDFRSDTKKEDGWVMLFHTLTNTDSKAGNYIFLYNLFTGSMKVFYYNNTLNITTNSLWVLSSSVPEKILDRQSFFSNPTNIQADNTSLTLSFADRGFENGVTALSPGWNGLEYQVPSYSAGNTQTMFVLNSFNSYITKYKFDGSIDLNSNGTILTTVPNGAKSSNGSKLFKNKTAENFVKKIGNDVGGTFGKIIKESAGVILGGAGIILTKGLRKIFSRSQKVTYTKIESKVNLTTTGSLKIDGDGVLATNSLVQPLSWRLYDILQSEENHSSAIARNQAPVTNLGTWTILSSPKIYWNLIKPFHVENIVNDGGGSEVYGHVESPTVDHCDVSVVFNPDIKKYIKSHKVTCEYIHYFKGPENLVSGNFYPRITLSPNNVNPLFLCKTDSLSVFDIPVNDYNVGLLASVAIKDSSSSQFFFKWELAPAAKYQTAVALTVDMNVEYMGKSFTVSETRIYKAESYANPSDLQIPQVDSYPSKILLNKNGNCQIYYYSYE